MVGVGQIVRVRSRQYLVEQVADFPNQDTLVSLSCLEDDALGESLDVLWEREVDALSVEGSKWEIVAKRGFDRPDLFSAYLHTLRWNCVTATDPKLFQAPYRAGIEVKAYQLAPLRQALQMPRVNLFIADDVGLGKTIEAGLILRELILRQKVRRVIISCPPSVVVQWKEEMESRFGLIFQVFDRDFVATRRRERGYGVNPWTTHTRFIISHALLRDEAYTGPLRDWLGDFGPGTLLILDEAHNAAPSSGARYAIDSQLTRVVKDLARRFEHKLFLSATPHNGHSNSFSALLEMLDPQRFCRGVPVKNQKLLDAVMVRRLKGDLREVGEEFPLRRVIPVMIDGLPKDAPELVLSQLLSEYRKLREERLADAPRSARSAALLVITSLQKRLVSSIEAFARTLQVHQTTLQRAALTQRTHAMEHFQLLVDGVAADDERADLDEDEVQTELETQMAQATQAASSVPLAEREKQLLEQMMQVANQARFQPDPRIKKLAEWIKANLCPKLGQPGAPWLERRVLIFTEYTDTKRYLQQQLGQLIGDSDRAEERIAFFHGGIGEERREEIKRAFNADPKDHPLRILVATDAAREGVNLQNHCADLFHFDVPWNPSRMEQRNGRIDRKLQRAPEVHCYYFVLAQRTEDRVLQVLVQKTEIIQQELGSLSPVIERKVSALLAQGIRHDQTEALQQSLETLDLSRDEDEPGMAVVRAELEGGRLRQQKLVEELNELQGLLKKSSDWLGLSDLHFREALSSSLNVLNVKGLEPLNEEEARKDPDVARWRVPALDQDPSWATTLDALREPRKQGQKIWEWRRESPIRPVVFRDPGSLDGEVVHLHLENRLVQRLLGRFLAQGFLHDELTRACVLLTDDPIPRVLVLGRLSLYGERAARLHDEVIAMAAEWLHPNQRERRTLKPLPEKEKDDVLQLLEQSLATPRLQHVPEAAKNLLQSNASQAYIPQVPQQRK